MKKLILIVLMVLMLDTVVFALDLEIKGKMQMVNSNYSFKDFSGQSLIKRTDLSKGIIIARSNFYQENMPDRMIFPEDMSGVIFYECNLDNVFIPGGNTLIDCTNKRIKVQNDLRDWIVDADLKPIYLPTETSDRLNGLSTKAEEIPNSKLISRDSMLRILEVK